MMSGWWPRNPKADGDGLPKQAVCPYLHHLPDGGHGFARPANQLLAFNGWAAEGISRQGILGGSLIKRSRK